MKRKRANIAQFFNESAVKMRRSSSGNTTTKAFSRNIKDNCKSDLSTRRSKMPLPRLLHLLYRRKSLHQKQRHPLQNLGRLRQCRVSKYRR